MSLTSSCASIALWRDQKKRKERGKISLFTSFHEEKAAICQMPLHVNFAPLKAVMVQDKTIQRWSHYGWHIECSSIDLFPPLTFQISQQKLRLSLTCLPGRKRLCLVISCKKTTANVLSEMKKGRSQDSCRNNSWIVLKITLFNVLILPPVILGSDPM